jgi:ABC-type multidrug transport system fused ATPase/permease subunit
MFDIHEGAILVSGHDIKKWPLEQLRGLFSYVTQADGVFLSDMTLADTIRFARPDVSIDEVIRAAKCACIHDDIMKMPQNYGAVVGQRGQTLSKGQQQRIALAQALIALTDDRKVLILDEFTSALDSRTEQQIMQRLVPYLKGPTIRSITDRIVVVKDGRIIEEGSHAELVNQGGWYAEMARLQAVA